MSAANDPLAEPVPPDSAVLTSTSSPRCSASTARPSTTPFFAEKYRGSPRRDHVRILRAAVIDWLSSGQGRVSHSKREAPGIEDGAGAGPNVIVH